MRQYTKESHDESRQHIKKLVYHFADKGLYSQSYGFSSSHVWMWDYKKSWTPKTWCSQTVVMDCKEIKPVNPNRNQPWIFIGRTEAEAPILWPPDAKSWLVGKDSDTGKDWGFKKKGVTEGEMVGGHHWLNGHEFEQTLGDSEGWGSLAWCNPRGHKESDTT